MTAVDSKLVEEPSICPPGVDEIPAKEVPAGFEVLEYAGSGVFCDVWKIRHVRDGIPYALKRLRADWRSNAAARKLLATEAQVAAAVRSRNVVGAAAQQWNSSETNLVLEWLDGMSLEDRLQAAGQVPVETAIWIARQSVQGLSAMEQAGYAHGDIKPANIVLTASGDVKLVDLGFARSIGNRAADGSSRVLTGTAEYMAPESLLKQDGNLIAKDIYSLGVTLFRMLTGELPFAADTTAGVLYLQRTARPPQLRRKCPDVPTEFAQLVQQMLAKHPIRRPTSLRELVRTLIDFELNLFPKRFAA